MDLKLREESYQRALTEGLRHVAQIVVKGRVRWVKVVVYDYDSDLAGTAVVKVW